MGIGKNLQEIYLEFSHFFKKVYPDFITAGKTDKLQGVPVFAFHTVKPEIFKEQLVFLKENNYVTVGADDFRNYLAEGRTLPEKAVLLTMDDGRKSVWKYGFPLLEKYGFRATVFIIPGHTKDNPPIPPLEKGGEGGFEDTENESNDREILSWQEISEMKESGIIDFGSHTLYHNKIFTGPEIVDFYGYDQKTLPYDYPAVPEGFESYLFEKGKDEFFGMPIYSNDSPMKGSPRFRDDKGLREGCIEYYKGRFGKNGPSMGREWKKAMHIFASDFRKMNKPSAGYSSTEETAKEIYDNLSISKKLLEEKLGKPVNHLCYPFGIWSPLSNEMAKKAGYLSSFCAYIPGKPINISGDDPYKIVRLKDDYIFRLPGKGRKSLAEIFHYKFKRRLKGERVY